MSKQEYILERCGTLESYFKQFAEFLESCYAIDEPEIIYDNKFHIIKVPHMQCDILYIINDSLISWAEIYNILPDSLSVFMEPKDMGLVDRNWNERYF